MFVAYCGKNPDSLGFLFFLKWRDIDDKELPEKREEFSLEEGLWYWKGIDKKGSWKGGCGWLDISFNISISCFFNFSLSSAINFSSFFVGSLSINDFVTVSKLCSMASLFFFSLHSPFLFAVALMLLPRSFSESVFWLLLKSDGSTLFEGSADYLLAKNGKRISHHFP